MTEKIARRGVHVPSDYSADYLSRRTVAEVCSRHVETLRDSVSVEDLRTRLLQRDPLLIHQGYPVVDSAERLVGIVTVKQVLDKRHEEGESIGRLSSGKIVVVYESTTLRQAADLMVQANIGRLPVVSATNPSTLVGIVSRSDLLTAHTVRLNESNLMSQTIVLPFGW